MWVVPKSVLLTQHELQELAMHWSSTIIWAFFSQPVLQYSMKQYLKKFMTEHKRVEGKFEVKRKRKALNKKFVSLQVMPSIHVCLPLPPSWLALLSRALAGERVVLCGSDSKNVTREEREGEIEERERRERGREKFERQNSGRKIPSTHALCYLQKGWVQQLSKFP